MIVEEETRASDRLWRIAYKLSAPLGALASFATFLVMVAIVVDVVSRSITGESVPGLLEMSESALVAAVFLGLAYAGTTDAHVSVDLLTSHVNRTIARVLITATWIVSVLLTTWFLISAVERAIDSVERDEVRTGLVNWPLWPARWIIVIGFASFLVIAIINVVLLFLKEPALGRDNLTTEEVVSQAAQEVAASDVVEKKQRGSSGQKQGSDQ